MSCTAIRNWHPVSIVLPNFGEIPTSGVSGRLPRNDIVSALTFPHPEPGFRGNGLPRHKSFRLRKFSPRNDTSSAVRCRHPLPLSQRQHVLSAAAVKMNKCHCEPEPVAIRIPLEYWCWLSALPNFSLSLRGAIPKNRDVAISPIWKRTTETGDNDGPAVNDIVSSSSFPHPEPGFKTIWSSRKRIQKAAAVRFRNAAVFLISWKSLRYTPRGTGRCRG